MMLWKIQSLPTLNEEPDDKYKGEDTHSWKKGDSDLDAEYSHQNSIGDNYNYC